MMIPNIIVQCDVSDKVKISIEELSKIFVVFERNCCIHYANTNSNSDNHFSAAVYQHAQVMMHSAHFI